LHSLNEVLPINPYRDFEDNVFGAYYYPKSPLSFHSHPKTKKGINYGGTFWLHTMVHLWLNLCFSSRPKRLRTFRSVVTNRTKGCMWRERKSNGMSQAGFDSGSAENKD